MEGIGYGILCESVGSDCKPVRVRVGWDVALEDQMAIIILTVDQAQLCQYRNISGCLEAGGNTFL